ncbi:MAG: aspartate racemase, partial [Motiliproteus sp.]
MVMEGTYRVKFGAIDEGGAILDRCMVQMLQCGVERVILGCTEIPLALARINSIYSVLGKGATQALATSSVQWHATQENRNVA